MRKRICLCICGMLLILGLSACSETGEGGLDVAVQEETQAEDVQEPQAAEQSAPEAQISDAQRNGVLIAYFTWADNTVVTDEEAALQSAHVENMDQYDTIFLGYPNWWADCPMAVLSFIEEYDLSGKTVALFCSHGTGGVGRSVRTITEALPEDCTVIDDVLGVYRPDVPGAQSEVQEWLSRIGLDGAGEAAEDAGAEDMETEETDMTQTENRQIRVLTEDGGVIVFELNDSSAADDLYAQLPLTTQIEDFSTNEKIFYPEELDISDTPQAGTEIGTLAYYAPWGDVVMFYEAYQANASLYELGYVVSGEELIPGLSGTVTIEAAD